jgi:hypothetical protein
MTLAFSRQNFELYSHIKYHKNPSSGSRVVPCILAGGDGNDEANSPLASLLTRLKIVKLKSVSGLNLSYAWNWCIFVQQIMSWFKKKIILVIILFIYSTVSVPQKKVYIYPECATSARTWEVSAVQPAYPFTESVCYHNLRNRFRQ